MQTCTVAWSAARSAQRACAQFSAIFGRNILRSLPQVFLRRNYLDGRLKQPAISGGAPCARCSSTRLHLSIIAAEAASTATVHHDDGRKPAGNARPVRAAFCSSFGQWDVRCWAKAHLRAPLSPHCTVLSRTRLHSSKCQEPGYWGFPDAGDLPVRSTGSSIVRTHPPGPFHRPKACRHQPSNGPQYRPSASNDSAFNDSTTRNDTSGLACSTLPSAGLSKYITLITCR